MSQMHDGRAIHLHHFEQALDWNRGEFSGCAEAGVVDEHVDFDCAAHGEIKNLARSAGRSEIGRTHFGAHAVLAGQFRRQLFEAIAPPRAENQIRSACR